VVVIASPSPSIRNIDLCALHIKTLVVPSHPVVTFLSSTNISMALM